jgi:hypothetical protein
VFTALLYGVLLAMFRLEAVQQERVLRQIFRAA